jgi:hypothetical protein
MKNLGITEEEALDIIECDKRIDKGEKLFELTEDQKQAVRKVSQTRSVDAYGKTRIREKKEDQEKREIVGILADALASSLPLTELVVVNEERELTFKVGNRKFKIVLSAPRK